MNNSAFRFYQLPLAPPPPLLPPPKPPKPPPLSPPPKPPPPLLPPPPDNNEAQNNVSAIFPAPDRLKVPPPPPPRLDPTIRNTTIKIPINNKTLPPSSLPFFAFLILYSPIAACAMELVARSNP